MVAPSGAPGWFHYQLGFNYFGLSNLPENFIYNTGNEHPLRRLVSTFLSPLASSYLFVVALLLAAAWLIRRRPPGGARSGSRPPRSSSPGSSGRTRARLTSRSSLGLVALALVRREYALPLIGAAAVVLVSSVLFVKAYPQIAPVTSFTPDGAQAAARTRARGLGPASATSGASDASTASHWRSLRAGVRTVIHHPQGFGVGNAGSTAARTGVRIKAGESTYTELGVDAGLLGALLFVAWLIALLRIVLPCTAWLGAALVAVLALGLQTDVIGVPWLAYVLFGLRARRAGVVATVRTRPSHQL